MLQRARSYFLLCFLLGSLLHAEIIDSFYGPIEVNEPVLIELIKCPAFQRLKHVHQYGVAYYTTHHEEYSRYDHSIGVFTILKKNGASLEEQIAGLLHDVSHTVFSHVGDWVFGKEYQEEDYQSTIYKMYISHSGIEDILIKFGYTIEKIHPKNKAFTMLEQGLPNLCADRIDYNIQGAFYQNYLTKAEAIELFNDLRFHEKRWVGTRIDLLKKIADFALFMTQECWGGAGNYATSRWLADAMLKGLAAGLLSWKEIHCGIDQNVWDLLQSSQDPFIKKRMHMIAHWKDYFRWTDPTEADILVKFRCRGIDPWVLHENQIIRLSFIDMEYAKEFALVKQRAAEGWPIKLLDSQSQDYFGQ